MHILDNIARKGKLPLAWATVAVNKNFGDELSPFINSEMVRPAYEIIHSNFDQDSSRLVSVGTILHEFKNGNLFVWGTGMDRELFDPKKFRSTNPSVFAIRGKLSYGVLERAGFITGECAVGDPGILISRFLQPAPQTKYELGIIPHISNYNRDSIDDFVFECFRLSYPPFVKIIDPRLGIGETVAQKINEITECKRILSSSVHGIIVADSFGIPNVFMHEDYAIPNGLYHKERLEKLEHRIDDYYSVYDDVADKPYYNQRRREAFDIEAIVQSIDNCYSDKTIEGICSDLLASHPVRQPA